MTDTRWMKSPRSAGYLDEEAQEWARKSCKENPLSKACGSIRPTPISPGRDATRPAVGPQTFGCTWKALDTLLYQQSEWLTGCEYEHVFKSGDPEENGFAFCPYCGGKIEVYRK